MRTPYPWPLGLPEAVQAGLYLCPSHQTFLYQLPEQEQQQVPLQHMEEEVRVVRRTAQ